MKRIITAILSWMLLVCFAAVAEQPTALEAFNALLNQDEMALAPIRTSASWLDDVMAGKYALRPTDTDGATAMAADLAGLCGITNSDMAAYASMHDLKMAQVRNAYYKALANVLMAEIMVNPASEEKYQNAQTILKLFLEPEPNEEAEATKTAIRAQMSPEYSRRLAEQASLPIQFVEFVIMDDTWDDDSWENDDEWRGRAAWNTADEAFADITIGSRDANGSTRIADMQEILISLGYLRGKADGVFGPRTQSALLEFQLANGLPATGMYTSVDLERLQAVDTVARWEYDDDFWDSQDLDTYATTSTPDTDNTPDTHDDNTPDTPRRNSPDTPKRNSPDTHNTPDSPNTHNTPKRNSPDSPDTD